MVCTETRKTYANIVQHNTVNNLWYYGTIVLQTNMLLCCTGPTEPGREVNTGDEMRPVNCSLVTSDRAAAGEDGHVLSESWSTKTFHSFGDKRGFTKLTSTQLTEKIKETETARLCRSDRDKQPDNVSTGSSYSRFTICQTFYKCHGELKIVPRRQAARLSTINLVET